MRKVNLKCSWFPVLHRVKAGWQQAGLMELFVMAAGEESEERPAAAQQDMPARKDGL